MVTPHPSLARHHGRHRAAPAATTCPSTTTRYAEHVARLIATGCDGVVPNGSLGEYQTLTAEERARVVATAVEAAGERRAVMPGVAAYGAAESRRWAEQAAEAGRRVRAAAAAERLPRRRARGRRRTTREVAEAGLPVVAYNNPFDTKVDLTPELLAELHDDGHIVAVKEFSGDVRRGLRDRRARARSWTC